ncbi:hypothetical protein HNP84_010269 [Thermocatellispora tengchongensis]|uniref:Uncharacterized protein n=1 Tax=Thermocatellispora tengchongensis TaxID=1073253 RepID=A0A840PRX5_9ACTN|nr:hypothetical protein [Thermocatellispora tengchongensis]MBB5140501.1 hypothetical protein [Thermocatellispora tengchongensis]
MRPAVAALGAAFVIGTLAFLAVVAHIVINGAPHIEHIAITAGSCLLTCTTVMLAVRWRPHISGITTPADVYEMGLEQVSDRR